jgi:hypothetical protein
MTKPVFINVTEQELDALLAQAKPTFSVEQYRLLEGVLGNFSYLMRAVQNAKCSLAHAPRALPISSPACSAALQLARLLQPLPPVLNPQA